MSVTLGELRQDVRAHLDEADPIFWNEPELNIWIWEGLREVARRSENLQKQKVYTVVADQEAYPLPDDMLRIYRVEFRRDTNSIYPLEWRNFNEMDSIWGIGRGISGSTPMYYSIWSTPGEGGKGLYIYPIPSDTIGNGLWVWYYGLPRKPVEDDDIAEIQAGYEDLITLYVEFVARRKEATDNRWREAYELFETRLKEMMKTTRNWTDQQGFFGDANPGDWDW